MLKTIIIGFGQIAGLNRLDPKTRKTYRFSSHIQAIKNSKKFKLSGVVDKSTQSLNLAKNKFGIKNTFSTIEEARNNLGDFDVAIISTPPSKRFSTIVSLGNIKGLIIEKPVSIEIEESQKIRNFINKSKILCEVNYWRRFVPYFNKKKIKKMIGSLQAVKINYCGGLKNNGVHLIDFVRLIYGEITPLNFFKNSVITKAETLRNDYNINFFCNLKKKIPLYGVYFDKKYFRENSIEFLGSKGKLSLHNDSRELYFYKLMAHKGLSNNYELDNNNPRRLRFDHDLALSNLYKCFYSVLTKKRKVISPISNALKNEILISNFFKSLKL